jgi:hypothetical protein
MIEGDLFITVASWEDRFYLGAEREFRASSPRSVLLYYSQEYHHWSRPNIDKFVSLCGKHRIGVEQEHFSLKDPARAWESLRSRLMVPTVARKRVTVDITTMPRDIIWFVFYFLRQANCSVQYIYHRPESYSLEWLSRDPGRPRLVYKMSGIARIGLSTTLVVMTGYDVRRTEQLIRFYEPKRTLLGIQMGEQHGNLAQNVQSHRELISEAEGVSAFDVNAYDADHGLGALSGRLEQEDVRDTNIVMSSLGPKLSAVALFRYQEANPHVALSYAPSQEYNRDYSSGISQTLSGEL